MNFSMSIKTTDKNCLVSITSGGITEIQLQVLNRSNQFPLRGLVTCVVELTYKRIRAGNWRKRFKEAVVNVIVNL